MKAIRDKTNEADTPTTRDPAPLGDDESGHSRVLLGSLHGQLLGDNESGHSIVLLGSLHGQLLGDNESGHSSVLLGSLYGQLMEGSL